MLRMVFPDTSLQICRDLMLKHGCDRNTATFFKQHSMKKRTSLYCVMRAVALMPAKTCWQICQ